MKVQMSTGIHSLERSGESGGKGREGTKDSVEFVLLLRCLQDNQVEMDI